jgi:hypothetical protein
MHSDDIHDDADAALLLCIYINMIVLLTCNVNTSTAPPTKPLALPLHPLSARPHPASPSPSPSHPPTMPGPGLSVDDQITLPYPVVLGFNYLLASLPMETEAFLDATLEAMVNEKLQAAEDELDAQIAAVEGSDATHEEKEAMVAELEKAKALVERVRVVSE